MYWKQLALLFKVYQHLISNTLPLLNNNTASLHCNLATWMKAASEEKRTKCEGHTVSDLHMSVYTGLHEYTETVFPTRDDWRLSWDAGEQLDSGKIKGYMSFSHTPCISCLVCWLMLICRCTFIPCWDRKPVYFFLFRWEMVAHWNFKIL